MGDTESLVLRNPLGPAWCHNCVIKRGEKVLVKRKFAEVLDNSDLQDYETSKLIEKKSSEFTKSEF